MAIEIFLSYSHRDEELRNELMDHLSLLERQGLIASWHDRKIIAGQNWDCEINKNLNKSHIIIFLISSSFIASKYCSDVEVCRAIERHTNMEAIVIPIILRHCDWQSAPFGHIQALPTDAKPVLGGGWKNRDEAFTNIVYGIKAVVDKLVSNPSYDLLEGQRKPVNQTPLPDIYTAMLTQNEGSEYTRKLEVELTINRDFETYTIEDQERLLRAIRELLNIKGNINIKMIDRGSVKLTIELSQEEAEALYREVHEGRLQEYSVVKAILQGTIHDLTPRWRLLHDDEVIRVSPAWRVVQSSYVLVRLGVEFVLPSAKFTRGEQWHIVSSQYHISLSAQGEVQPQVLAIYPEQFYEGISRTIKLELGSKFSATKLEPSQETMNTDIAIGTVAPIVIGFCGDQRNSYWQIDSRSKLLEGIYNFWLLLKLPPGIPVHLVSSINADLRAGQRLIPIGTKKRMYGQQTAIIIQT
jgi:hypothetical protein